MKANKLKNIIKNLFCYRWYTDGPGLYYTVNLLCIISIVYLQYYKIEGFLKYQIMLSALLLVFIFMLDIRSSLARIEGGMYTLTVQNTVNMLKGRVSAQGTLSEIDDDEGEVEIKTYVCSSKEELEELVQRIKEEYE